MKLDFLKHQLDAHPKVTLCDRKTAIEHLPRLSHHLGIELWVKRDDSFSLAFGGNKVRQLEYYLGPASMQGADTVLITGAVQSNFVRLCAAAARKLGWHPVVQLENRVPNSQTDYANSGNVWLNQLLGAEIHYFPEGENEAAADANLDKLAAQHLRLGKKPYVIHLGVEHPPLGGLGYVQCAIETAEQLEAESISVDHIVLPSGSGLTHAGFLAGALALDWKPRIQGICVRRSVHLQHPRIIRRTTEILQLIEASDALDSDRISVDDTVLQPGYGQINSSVVEAMQLSAELEGLLLDPVYSGRTMAGLIERVRRQEIKKNEQVLFIHTGGQAALFAYQSKLKDFVH